MKLNSQRSAPWSPLWKRTEVMTMLSLPLSSHPQPAREPFSPQTLAKTSRLRAAAITDSVCPYCAVGCGQLVATRAAKVMDRGADPRTPISEGTLCPRGAAACQLALSPHRVPRVMCRAPFPDRWELKPLDW